MKSHFLRNLPALALAMGLTSGSASAAIAYTETFDTNASGWLTGASTAAAYSATGGVGNSGYISSTTTFTSGATGAFGAPPLQILMRGNAASDASSDAYVGNWITAGISSLTVTVRHNYSEALNLYARLDAGGGAAASLANLSAYAVLPDTWTTITIPIFDSPASSTGPFLSYGGAGAFEPVFSNIQNVQLGFYVPASTTITNLVMDVDTVTTAVPEPASLGLAAFAGAGFVLRRRRARA
ncbi:MAG: PEP-CTERM sorting domain-containing protein [Akkermansiaceae bacterium]|nr:PEP-CTERM sorting domain-containing protein [Akkermansiaceae bacterium]